MTDTFCSRSLKVHAEASSFVKGVKKEDVYAQIIAQIRALSEGQRDWVRSFQFYSPVHRPADLSRFIGLMLIRCGEPSPSARALYVVSESMGKVDLIDEIGHHSNTANAAALLWHGLHSLPQPSSNVNWAGFYVNTTNPTKRHACAIDMNISPALILGPFQGKVACQSIAFGRGVCGTAAADSRTVRVADVDNWPGHIACDAESKSEIVVPIVKQGVVSVFVKISTSSAWPSARGVDHTRDCH